MEAVKDAKDEGYAVQNLCGVSQPEKVKRVVLRRNTQTYSSYRAGESAKKEKANNKNPPYGGFLLSRVYTFPV
jgi:hypothetical protein